MGLVCLPALPLNCSRNCSRRPLAIALIFLPKSEPFAYVKLRKVAISPTHLKAAIETVANFGKPASSSPETRQTKTQEAPISKGTALKL